MLLFDTHLMKKFPFNYKSMVIISLEVTKGQMLGGPISSFVPYVILSVLTKFYAFITKGTITTFFILISWTKQLFLLNSHNRQLSRCVHFYSGEFFFLSKGWNFYLCTIKTNRFLNSKSSILSPGKMCLKIPQFSVIYSTSHMYLSEFLPPQPLDTNL